MGEIKIETERFSLQIIIPGYFFVRIGRWSWEPINHG